MPSVRGTRRAFELTRPLAVELFGVDGVSRNGASDKRLTLAVVMAAYEAALARICVELNEQATVPETVELVMQYAVGAVGADSASVMLLHRGGRGIEIAGTTDALAERADRLQLAAGEGPCVDSARDDAESAAVADTLTDRRWPVWCRRVAEDLGIRSVLSVQLGTPSARVGALNLYAAQPGRFNGDDLAVAHVLARHAAVALARGRHESNLLQAIDARKLIGQAQGMLMERFGLDAEQSFAVLRRYSQDNNIKLRDVAQRLIDTRQLPSTVNPTDPGDSVPSDDDLDPGKAGDRDETEIR